MAASGWNHDWPVPASRSEVTLGDGSRTVDLDRHAASDTELVRTVATSRTPSRRTDEGAMTHAITDLVSNIGILGGVDGLVVDADLADAYHAPTIGAVRAAHDRGVVRRV